MKKSKQIYFNRELSWLSFNQRVLDQASRSSNPLLERLKFIAISASNLDEFFMVRVGGLAMIADSATVLDINGWTPTQQLEKIRSRVKEMYSNQSECLLNELEPLLAGEGIERVDAENLTTSELKFLRNRFHEEMMSSLAPIAIENTETFPALSGARICMCVRLKNDFSSRLGAQTQNRASLDQVANRENDRYVLIPMGKFLARFQSLPSKTGYRYMLTEDVIGMFLSEFFGEQEIIEWNTLRVTRNGDVDLEEDGRADLLIGMQAMLEARRKSQCVRLEISAATSLKMQAFLQNSIDVQLEDVYSIQGPLGLSDYFSLASLRGFPSLNDANWPAQPSPEFSSAESIFQTIASGDRLLYHPYQSYEPIVQFTQAAANDPAVIAVKQTLYRTSESSEIVKALCLAAENGKHVTVIVELKARFDEARNINWAKVLADAGVDVIYGVRGLKTHAKMCLVVRREPTGIKRYIHFGTGNYNESTAEIYSDASLFTCDEKLGRDSVHFFNAITGLSVPQTLEKLIAAPINLRESLLEMIRIETESATRGNAAAITAKANSLVDKQIIDELYLASQAGVKIRLNIRGICCLVPGKKGLSENIRVISVVDRLLEHARIFHFHHGGDERIFISSADWMGRNLDRRIELMVPVLDKNCKSRLTKILRTYFDDNLASSELQPNGDYLPVTKKRKKKDFRSQLNLHQEACQIHSAQTNPKHTVFEPHRVESPD